MMERIDEFTVDDKNFMYIDFSNLVTNTEFLKVISEVEPIIAKYPSKSLYTITNIEKIKFDTKSKEIVARYVKHNEPYVKHGVIIGIDGIKKVFVTAALKLGGRSNMHFAFSKEKAINWLLQQD
jgi:hypothetical protein